jgi:HEAT repeat protein
MCTPRGIQLRVAALAAAAVLVALPVPAQAGQGAPPAAPQASSLESILAEFAAWDGGIQSGPRWALRDYLRAHRDDPAGRERCESLLVAYLSSRATHQAKMEAARHLRTLAGDAAVPALRKLLDDPKTADYAVFVLQQVPGAAADGALLQAAGARRLAVPTRQAVVGALGMRRSAAAVPALVPLLANRDLASAAATALGRVGNAAAREALTAAFPKAVPPLKGVLASALLLAGGQAEANEANAALAVYDSLAADASLPRPIRQAALMGRIDASGGAAFDTLLQMLGGADDLARDAAMARAREVVPADKIEAAGALVPKVPEGARIQLLTLLAAYPAERVRPAVLQAARTESGAVRVAALRALGTTGDVSVLDFLVETAAKARGAEQAAAREALNGLKGREVDAAIVSALDAKPAPELATELLLAAADRRIFAAKPSVASRLSSPDPRVRREALKALRTIGTPSDLPAVLDVVIADEDARADAELTVAALARMAAPNRRAMAIRMRLRTEKRPDARVALLGLLPFAGDGSALADLRTALADPQPEVADAAARALAEWPTREAYDDLVGLARGAREETHKLLAVRGLIRMVTLEPHRLRAAAVADLCSIAEMATRDEERKLVLGALAQFPGREALEAARRYLSQPGLEAEARAAIESITEQLERPRWR